MSQQIILEELDQNVEMAETLRKHKLSIHHSNLFNPKPLSITGMALGVNIEFMAITKEHIYPVDVNNQPLTIIEIYRISPNDSPKLVQTILEYEQLTGIVWVSVNHILTVSKEQTINLYDTKTGSKVFTTITDYGPILCMKFSIQEGLLLTGTEYGYVTAYRIRVKPIAIEPVCKMVKINAKIQSIDFATKPRKDYVVKSIKPSKVRPGKRKRSDTSDESDDEDDDSDCEEFLASSDITIYGASLGDVIAWDYHRKTIIETIHVGDSSCFVNSLLALKNGDIVTGDSSGTISIFDHNTFTCRQNIKVLLYDILCLATSCDERCILVSGRDPTIIIMKREKASNDEFVLFEKMEAHTHDVTSMIFMSRHRFFTGGLDGFLIKFRIKGINQGKKRVLAKIITLPNYSNHIKFSNGEMMVQHERTLVIWKLPDKIGKDLSQDADQPKPIKLLLLKVRAFVHSSTFSDKWICYSTKKGLHIFSRSGEKLISFSPNKKVPNCNVLELCSDNRYLAAGANRTLYIIDLATQNAEQMGSEKDLHKCSVVSECHLKSNIRQIIDFASMDLLVVACGFPKSMIYTFSIKPGLEAEFRKFTRRISTKQHQISFITYNAPLKRESSIYIYTNEDQIIKLDLSEEGKKEALSKLDKQDRIIGLPEDVNILGMVFVSREHCILYDSNRMFKIDLTANKVVNENSNYNYILKMDNFVFKKYDQVALVELTPDDYMKTLPAVKNPKKKFGH